MSDELIREVDEDIRKERYEKLWKRYGAFVIAGALAIVVATASVVGWREYQSSQRLEQSAAFSAAVRLVENGDLGQAADAFATLAGEAGSGYRALASLREASIRLEQGEREAALAIYDRVAQDSGVDDLLRDLAALLGVLHQIDSGDTAELRSRLALLSADDKPFRYSARELEALVALKAGDTAGAKQSLAGLTDDPLAPSGIRARAAELLAALGGLE